MAISTTDCAEDEPTWKCALLSHEATFATSWGRAVRRLAEQKPELGIAIAPDAGAASEWETSDGGGVLARSLGGSLTGRGAKVMILDDVVKDFAAAHSAVNRETVWEWWLSVAQTRLEPPSLTVAIGTRWHDDDILGRLLSDEHEGDPADWERIRLPALAEEDDILGRELGEPLLSPLVDETPDEALARWEKVRRAVGSHTWAAMYQQRPTPLGGAVLHADWWAYHDVVTAPPAHEGRWLTSWDLTFGTGGEQSGDYVVGGAIQYVDGIAYIHDVVRFRGSFNEQIRRMRAFAAKHDHINEHVVEQAANGAAAIETLRRELTGIVGIKPIGSKLIRTQSIAPMVEARQVSLPKGAAWVPDFVAECAAFPSGLHDDQVDMLSQALTRLRRSHGGTLQVIGGGVHSGPSGFSAARRGGF